MFNEDMVVCEIDLSREEMEGGTMATSDVKRLTFTKCDGLDHCLFDELQRLAINSESMQKLTIEHCRGVECILTCEQSKPQKAEFKHPFQNLFDIDLCGLPDFIGMMTYQQQDVMPTMPIFSNLEILVISDCNKMKKLGLPVWELKSLIGLRIKRCDELEETTEVPENKENQASLIHLPKLQWLQLCELPKLKNICKVMVVCNSIRRIQIERCPSIRKLTLVFGQPNYDSPPSNLEGIYLHKEEVEWWESLELQHPSLKPRLQPFLMFS